jgi:hypothetical protein
MIAKLLPVTLSVLFASTASSLAIKIQLDYTYDTNGFFNQTGAKAALRAVADFYEPLLTDSLSRIDTAQWPAGNTWTASFTHPGTGAPNEQITNLVVPANTLIVYAGGRALGGPAGRGGPGGYSASGNSQAWFDLLASRGQAGALAPTKTDFGPWGGMVTFDTSLTWNFSSTGPVSGKIPFVSIALHEFGHLLGIGTSLSWNAKVSGTNFTGPASALSFGGNVPLQTGGSHWRDDGMCVIPNGHLPGNPNNVLSKAFGSFGTLHGFDQIVLMDPSSCTAGSFHKVMTDLDLAALKDIGWQLSPPVRWLTANTQPSAGPVAFTWPSTSGITYRVELSTTLADGSWDTLTTVTGNGVIKSYTDASPPAGKAFYRLNTAAPAAPAALPMKTSPQPPLLEPAPSWSPEILPDGCGFSADCCQ